MSDKCNLTESACRSCGAPMGYVSGTKLVSAIRSKREAQADVRELKARLIKAKADAVMHFVDIHLGAFESGFTDSNILNLQQLHRTAQNHVKDNYGVETDSLNKVWGDEMAKEFAKPVNEVINITAAQLHEAAEYAAPNGDEEMGENICIQWLTEEQAPDCKGYYIWFEQCPEEGVIGPLGVEVEG